MTIRDPYGMKIYTYFRVYLFRLEKSQQCGNKSVIFSLKHTGKKFLSNFNDVAAVRKICSEKKVFIQFSLRLEEKESESHSLCRCGMKIYEKRENIFLRRKSSE